MEVANISASVTGVSPNSGSTNGTGSTQSITITGQGFTGATSVLFGSVGATSFTVVSDTKITVAAPMASSGGGVDVQVNLPTGLTPKNPPYDQYNYVAPSVTGVNPNTGSISGTGQEQQIVITGNGFTGATSVMFGAVGTSYFTVVSDTKITAALPIATAGCVDVIINLPAGPTKSNPPFDKFTYIAPAVTGLNPDFGSTNGSGTNQQITIMGTGFSGATSVQFGGVGVTAFTIDSDVQITSSYPPGEAGTVDVQVNLPNGLTPKNPPADQFTYKKIPQIKSISPTTGPNAGGNSVVINGDGFSGATAVMFGNVKATVNAMTDKQITTIVPPGAGTVDITVTTPVGTSATCAADQYQYAQIPFNFNIPSDIASQGVYMTMFGNLQANYTNQFGTVMSPDDNVCLINTGSGYDYILSTLPVNTSLPTFLSTNTAMKNYLVNIPNVAIQAERIVIQLGAALLTTVSSLSNGNSLPGSVINVESTAGFNAAGGTLYISTSTGINKVTYQTISTNSFMGCSGGTGVLYTGAAVSGTLLATPQVNNASGDVTAPKPSTMGNNVYDFFEFSYLPITNSGLTMTINTSEVDQFGIPINLKVSGGNVQPNNQVGVIPSRQNTISQFTQFVGASSPYAELVMNNATRILSPSDQLTTNPVSGVVVNNTPTISGALNTATVYSYVVTAVIDSTEIYALPSLAQSKPSAQGSIYVGWGANNAVSYYKVYRGTPATSSLTWALVADNVTSTNFTDIGAAGTSVTPKFDLLSNVFDAAITNLFNLYTSGSAPLSLTVTDGSHPSNGLQYNFNGVTKPAPAWVNAATNTTGNTVIEFSCISIANNLQKISPLIPIGSLFYVFLPFFNTNTQNPGNPNPPQWNGVPMYYADLFPTAMVFGGNGVFADNVQQAKALYNNSNQPQGLQQNAYSVALGSIEDKLNAALLRGIATSINPTNWANSPSNNLAVAGPGNGSLSNAQTYYYVITAFNNLGESTPSNETSYQPNNGSIKLSWNPVDNVLGYNIYRGTASGKENQLIATTVNTTFNDTSISYPALSLSPPVHASMQVPTNVAATLSNGGTLGTQTYYYVVTALGVTGESIASNEVNVTTSTTQQSVVLTWNAVANASAYKIYRGSSAGQENCLVGIIQGASVPTATFTDTGSVSQTLPPNIYYAPGTISDTYAQFFHQLNVSIGGMAYADPFDDQGNQSSTITVTSPQGVVVTIGNWK